MTDRVLPATGGGGSSLLADCATVDPTVSVKQIILTRAGTPDALNDVGAAMVAALGKLIVLGEYDYDV